MSYLDNLYLMYKYFVPYSRDNWVLLLKNPQCKTN